MKLICGDCGFITNSSTEADKHEWDYPGHLTFFEGCKPANYVPDEQTGDWVEWS